MDYWLLIFNFIPFVITLQKLSETRFLFLVIANYDDCYDSGLLTSPNYLLGVTFLDFETLRQWLSPKRPTSTKT